MGNIIPLSPATYSDPSSDTITAADLAKATFSPTYWVIPHILPGTGVNMIVAPPKCGKSLLILNAMIDTALGRPVWGKIPVERPSGILYLTFPIENGDQQVAKLLRNVCDDGVMPDNLHFVFNTPHYDFDYLAEKLDYFQDVRLVVIDTWGTFLHGRKLRNDVVENDRSALVAIRKVADAYKAGFLLIHHTSKPKGRSDGSWTDLVSGSNAVLGSCDCGYLLTRKDGETNATLQCKGRNIIECGYEFSFDVDTNQYGLLDWDRGLSQERKHILAVIQGHGGGITSTSIAKCLGKSVQTICNRLRSLRDEDFVMRDADGKYFLSDKEREYNRGMGVNK
ncbi:MAG: AAA family ATPase [Dehalococcoidales bacterium]|nr:AAA family ATPase [Dehalococcoidales bacterium]